MKKLRFINTIFFKYFFFYLALCALILLFSIPAYYVALSSLRTNYTERCWNSIEQSAEEFENSAKTLLHTHNKLIQDMLFLEVKNYKTESITIKEYGKLMQMQKRLSSNTSGIYLADEFFLLFDNNDKVLSKDRLFRSVPDCFDNFIQYIEYSSEDIYETLLTLPDATSLNQMAVLESSPVILNGANSPEEYITVATRPLSSNATLCALYSTETLLELFDLYSFPDNAFFNMETYNGIPLLTFRYEGALTPAENNIYQTRYGNENFTVLEQTLPNIKCRIIIGIPDSYFVDMVSPVIKSIIIYALSALAIGIITALLFAFFNYIPIKRLATMSLPGYGRTTQLSGHNEIVSIRKTMMEMDNAYGLLKTNYNFLEEAFRENLLTKLLCGMIHTKEDLNNVRLFIPQVIESYYVATIDISSDNNPSIRDSCMWVYCRFIDEMKEKVPVARINNKQIVVIFTENLLGSFSEFISNVATEAKKRYGVEIIVGVSEPNTGTTNAQNMYYQAQFCIASPTGTITLYSYSDKGKSQDIIDMIQKQNLYTTIISGDAEEVDAIIEKTVNILISCGASKEEVRQTYYFIRYMHDLVITYLKLDRDSVEFPPFDETLPVTEVFKRLSSVCRNICALHNEINKKHRYSDMLEYIHENFCDPDMYADTIATAFNISSKQVFRMVRKLTSYSFGEYINILRMEKAMELLKSPALPVNEVSIKCGYNSTNTFYRIFKKYYGVAPSYYRGCE